MALPSRVVAFLVVTLLGCFSGAAADVGVPPNGTIVESSYQLGAISAFAEMVDLEVKTLGLSRPMAPSALEPLLVQITSILQSNHVEGHRVTHFLVTDLYPASLTEGKHVVLIFKARTALDEYFAVGEEKARLEAAGRYHGRARTEVARRLGRLLSYPEATIDALIAKNRPATM
eukprot:Rhum_TRINITY_DN4284_c0_g1::Rhum_TRINITY_DN4284_c0_g1_i1::g.13716::m.13716